MSQALKNELYTFYSLDNFGFIKRSLDSEIDSLVKLVDLADKGFAIISHIAREARRPCMDVEWIREIWREMEIIDSGIELIKHTSPPLRPLISIFTYTKEALEGSDLASLAEQSCRIYEGLKEDASRLLQLIRGVNSLLEQDVDIQYSIHEELRV